MFLFPMRVTRVCAGSGGNTGRAANVVGTAAHDPLQSSAFWLRIIERYLEDHTDEVAIGSKHGKSEAKGAQVLHYQL